MALCAGYLDGTPRLGEGSSFKIRSYYTTTAIYTRPTKPINETE